MHLLGTICARFEWFFGVLSGTDDSLSSWQKKKKKKKQGRASSGQRPPAFG